MPNVVDRTPPYVEEVVPGSPAAKAGLQPDDLIVYVDGELVPSIKSFQRHDEPIRARRRGQARRCSRGDKLKTVEAEAGRDQPKTTPK